jgi:hypothetical protein
MHFQYPLPHICHIVDSTMSCELLSFLDAYSGYHQISLTVDDEEKTAFITSFEIFCYTKMAFRLKNEGATYQKCVHTVLEGQIGQNVEAYIDDIVVKSQKREDLLDDLRKFKMMLNPKRCVFGVSSGKLLGYMVSSWGLTRTRRRWKSSKNCNHLRLEKKSRSWQA